MMVSVMVLGRNSTKTVVSILAAGAKTGVMDLANIVGQMVTFIQAFGLIILKKAKAN